MVLKKIKLDGLESKELENLKRMAKHCKTNEMAFRGVLSINLVGRIQDKALMTKWGDKASVAEYESYSRMMLKTWFPYMDNKRIEIETNNIRTKNSININEIVKDMNQIAKELL